MKIDLEFAELHSPLFFLGKNFGLKLDNTKHSNIEMAYDDERHWLVVGWQGRETYVPVTNVSNMTPRAVAKPIEIKKPEAPRPQMTAQVETPQSHVHAGPGHGKR